MKNEIGPSTFRVHQVNDDAIELIVNGIPIGELYEYSNKDILMEAVKNGQKYYKQLGLTKGILYMCLALTMIFGVGTISNGLYMNKLKVLADNADRKVNTII